MRDTDAHALLTPRELEVLAALAEGMTNKAIARRLDISLHTVKFHVESVFRKLGARTRTEAVAKASERRRHETITFCDKLTPGLVLRAVRSGSFVTRFRLAGMHHNGSGLTGRHLHDPFTNKWRRNIATAAQVFSTAKA